MSENKNVDEGTGAMLFAAGKIFFKFAAGAYVGAQQWLGARSNRGVTPMDLHRPLQGLPLFADIRGNMLTRFFKKDDFESVREFGSSLIAEKDFGQAFNTEEAIRVENMLAVGLFRTTGMFDGSTAAEDLDSAETLLQRAQSRGPRKKILLSILTNRQLLANKRGNYGEAERIAAEMFAIDPTYADAMHNHLCSASLRHDEQSAVSRLRVLVQHRPEYAQADSTLHTDPDLEWLRTLPIFYTIVVRPDIIPSPSSGTAPCGVGAAGAIAAALLLIGATTLLVCWNPAILHAVPAILACGVSSGG